MANKRLYMTKQELAFSYRISDDTVRRKASSGEWPCERIGRLYRFSPEHQAENAQTLAGSRGRGYDKDRLNAALRQLADPTRRAGRRSRAEALVGQKLPQVASPSRPHRVAEYVWCTNYQVQRLAPLSPRLPKSSPTGSQSRCHARRSGSFFRVAMTVRKVPSLRRSTRRNSPERKLPVSKTSWIALSRGKQCLKTSRTSVAGSWSSSSTLIAAHTAWSLPRLTRASSFWRSRSSVRRNSDNRTTWNELGSA